MKDARNAGPGAKGLVRLLTLTVLGEAAAWAAVPAGYQGKPFNDAAYRAAQEADARQPKLPYGAFAPALTLWAGGTPTGSGWVGKEQPSATIGLEAAETNGRALIHYHVAMPNYRYAVFGWNWAKAGESGVDLRPYDAVSFSIRVTGPKPPQELFFGVDELDPAPISLRDYDPDFSNGAWHRITIPVRAMKWSQVREAAKEVKGLAFKTFVWDPAEYDIWLDRFTLDRAVKGSPAPPPPPELAGGKPQAIPGRLGCAFYDLGGEGVAYHDTTPVNTLSGVLNQQRRHQRAHATAYEWNFRRDEGVDVSFTKDWADLNHTNRFDIGPNQLYLGGAEDGEWCRYTVEVNQAGSYKIFAAYGNDANGQRVRFSLNDEPAGECTFPVVTGSMHNWNRAEVGTIKFAEAGTQVLTLHYGRGFNLAYFEFVDAP